MDRGLEVPDPQLRQQVSLEGRLGAVRLGGQGAPLAPGFHDQVLRHPTRTRVVLNSGGIANISVLVPGQPCTG